MLSVEDYRFIVPDKILADIYAKAHRLYRKHILHINSTYLGGGVAEILESLILLLNDVGVDSGWRVLHGNPDFFNITKKFHNALQGGSINLTEQKKVLYQRVNDNFSRFTHIDHDLIVVHDPQPLALIKSYKKCQPWIWRCHIDLNDPNPVLWDYLKNFLLKYDLVILSSERYLKKDLPLIQRVVQPAINPLSLKNKQLPDKTILKYIRKAGIPTDKPIITQVSRMDPWKDPEGVLDAFRIVKESVDCRLVFCYNLASDDPEGIHIYEKIYRKARSMVDKKDVIFVVGNNDILVNSVQRFASVVVQKSIREGFCLAVTEALWKAKPVVASNAGGIPTQIVDGENGYMLDPNDTAGFAERITYLLKNPKEGERLGQNGQDTVRKRFFTTRLLSDYLDIFNELLA